MDTIYQTLGVRAISKSVTKDESCIMNINHIQEVEAETALITPGLLRLILAFLSNLALEIAAAKRHQMVSYLLGVKNLEMTEAIAVSYHVKLSLGKMVTVKGRRMFRWKREERKLYVQKSEGGTTRMELATCFGEEISHVLLYERVDLIPSLTELLRIGFLVDFAEDEIEFLMRTKNLQLSSEDVDFLLDAFPFGDY
jgi:sacsin